MVSVHCQSAKCQGAKCAHRKSQWYQYIAKVPKVPSACTFNATPYPTPSVRNVFSQEARGQQLVAFLFDGFSQPEFQFGGVGIHHPTPAATKTSVVLSAVAVAAATAAAAAAAAAAGLVPVVVVVPVGHGVLWRAEVCVWGGTISTLDCESTCGSEGGLTRFMMCLVSI